MKRALKIFGYFLGGIVLLLAGTAAYFQIKGIPSYGAGTPAHLANLQVPRDSAAVAQGARIAAIMCKECHLNPQTSKLTGKPMAELPPMFGELATYNITRDSVHGIGTWTDGELYYFLRTGIRKNGSWAPPFMPKYERMAEQDIQAVIAWLRSDDPALTPDTREYPPNRYNFLVKVLANTLFEAPPLPTGPIGLPDPADPVATGRYLANDVFGCFHCHCGDVLKVDDAIPENSFGFYGGGSELKTREGTPILTANLTPDPETGIGKWTEQQFIDALKYGKNPRGGTLSYPMTPHTALTDQEAGAIFTYLKTVPALHHPVDRYKAAAIGQ